MKKILLAAISSALLAGCSSPIQKSASAIESTPPAYEPGELNRKSLYDLLVAEISGQRQQFDTALELYLKQAELTNDPGVAKRATRVAQYVKDRESMAKAAALWRQAEPDNMEPYQISASLLLHEGKFDEARPLLRKAMSENSERLLLVIRSQIPKMEQSTLQGYYNLLQEIQGDDPAASLITQGLLLIQMEQPEDGLKAFNGALALEPDNLDALVQKAELLRATGRTDEALALLKRKTLKMDLEENRQLHILYTQLLFQSGKTDQGRQQAEKLLKALPDDPQLKFYLGLLMLEYNQLKPASNIMQEILRSHPNDSRPHFYMGHIAQKENRIEDAVSHYIRVKDGKNILQSFSRALTLLDKPSDQARVQQIMKDGRASLPAMVPRFYALEAEWLNLRQLKTEALKVLNEALAQFDDDISLLYSRAMLQEATQFDLAEKDLRRILQLEPDNAMAQNALGYTLTLHTRRYKEALQLISKALEQRPDDAAIIDSMGWVLFKLGRVEEALPYLERAYKEVQDAEVASHLIQAYQAAGQRAKAEALLQKSLKQTPDSKELIEAARSLDMPQ
ncbi:tetratricopeptide repeat protein [Marinobacterium jannaschii]|uniref:tetratricopeptide repeat protein n=1 Tax=Marinobacterium jannaschii TaxID=64970 RepID=UPI00056101C4|nr:tetratricopeptide repeat protein [Marinobacterium jannaschii]